MKVDQEGPAPSPIARERRVPRLRPLLASSSVAALLIGGGAPTAFAACTISPTTNQTSVTNSSAINCINIDGITVTGNVTNSGPPTTGVITPTGATRPSTTGITINNASVGGSVVNGGQITALTGNGIAITNNAVVVGGISNSSSGMIAARTGNGILVGSAVGNGLVTISTFGGGITNSGTISLGGALFVGANGIMVGDFLGASGNSVTISTFTGGITNSGTISANSSGEIFLGSEPVNGNGIWLGGFVASNQSVTIATLTGGISNSGTISAQVNGIWLGGLISVFSSDAKFTMSTFAGGISNSGTIVAGANGIVVGSGGFQPGPSATISTFSGDISNSGMISAGHTGISVDSVLTFLGGISNSGTISGSTGIRVSDSGMVSIFDSGVIVGTGGTAVDLTGNALGNTFTLGPGYSITGNVLGRGNDTFQLGGTGAGSFDLTTIGSSRQYQGFTTFNVVSGTWTASGTYGQTDPWTVQGGTFIVNGNLASAASLTVNSGGSLEGTGTVGTTAINSGGTFAPGAPGVPGTAMRVSGSLAFQSGALYLVQVNPASATMANVTGTATLGGNVLAAFASGSYVSKRYDILHADSVSGAFASLGTTNLPAGLAANLSYSTTDVFLNLTATLGALGSGGLNGNQQAVATGLNNFFNDGGTLTPNFLNIFGLSGGNLQTALSQLSGEAATDGEKGAFDLMTSFLGLMLDPFVDGRGGAGGGAASGFAPEQQNNFPPDIALAYAGVMKAPPKQTFDQRWTAWGSAFGGSGTTDGNATAGTNTVTARDYGFAGGVDYHFSRDTVAGFALAGGGTNWGLAQGLGGGRSDAFSAGLYGIEHFGPAYVAADVAFANHWMTTNRIALGDQLTANFNGQSYGARVETGYRYAAVPTVGVTPYAALQAQSFHTPRYSEFDVTGGGFGLSYNAMSATDTRSELGARFDDATVWGAMPLVLRGRVAWAHDWVSNPALGAVFRSLPGANFTVNGATQPPNSALASAAADLHLTANWTLTAKLDGEFASGSQTYAGTGTLRYSW